MAATPFLVELCVDLAASERANPGTASTKSGPDKLAWARHNTHALAWRNAFFAKAYGLAIVRELKFLEHRAQQTFGLWCAACTWRVGVVHGRYDARHPVRASFLASTPHAHELGLLALAGGRGEERMAYHAGALAPSPFLVGLRTWAAGNSSASNYVTANQRVYGATLGGHSPRVGVPAGERDRWRARAFRFAGCRNNRET